MNTKKTHFWTSLPGILTGIAAVVTALTTLYLTLISEDSPLSSPLSKSQQLPVQSPNLKSEIEWNLEGEDTFTKEQSKWPTLSSTTLKGYNYFDAKIVGGKYRIDFQHKNPGSRIFDSPYGAAIRYRWAANVKMVNFDSEHIVAGILFGQRAGIGFNFIILSTGMWSVQKESGIKDVINTHVIEWTNAGIDPKKSNRLEVEVNGDHVLLRINTKVVGEYIDSELSGGTVGIYVGSGRGDTAATIDFDDFEYHRAKNH